MKDRQKKFLDRVVKLLVDETEVGNGWFNPPYYFPGSTSGRTNFKSIYLHTFERSTFYKQKNDDGSFKFERADGSPYSGLDTQLIYFKHYCKNNYGLNDEEMSYVWGTYMTELNNKYFNYSLDHE